MAIKKHAQIKLSKQELNIYSLWANEFFSETGDFNKIERLDYTKLLSEQNQATYKSMLKLKNEVV